MRLEVEMGWFDLFGTGKHYIPELPEVPRHRHPPGFPQDDENHIHSYDDAEANLDMGYNGEPEATVQSQGIFDLVGLLDKETIEKIKAILKVVETKDDGTIIIHLDLRIQKNG